MNNHPNLFQRVVAAVVPEQPFLTIENGERLIARVVISLVLARSNNGVCGVALPIVDAVAGAGQAYLGMRFIAETNVEHEVPIALPDHLAGGDLVPFPS